MPNILLKNLPVEIHIELKARAARHHRSVTGEIIACLESVVTPKEIDVELEIERVRTIRKRIKGFLTQELLEQYKAEGRK
ncbi:MAG: Arc family DNA-binding protein [Candidatus Ozemobacteraceae bacterium]